MVVLPGSANVKRALERGVQAVLALAFVLRAGPAVPADAPRTTWVPQKPVEIVVGTGPSGGVDRPARVIQRIVQEQRLVPVPVTVVNKPGASGAIAQVYLNQHAGDAHYISVSPPTLVTSYLTGKSQISYEDLTVIAVLASEYVAFAVPASSSIQATKDLTERLRRDPQSVSIGIGTGIGNNNHAAVGLYARAIGVDVTRLKPVVFSSPGEVLAALMGKHLDMAALAVSNLVPLVSNPQIRIISVTAPQRLSGALAGVPTLKEQGIDVVAQQWRAVIGPKDLSPAQIAYWSDVLASVVKSPEWKQYLDSVANDSNFRLRDEAREFVKEEQEKMKAMLTALGLTKTPQSPR